MGHGGDRLRFKLAFNKADPEMPGTSMVTWHRGAVASHLKETIGSCSFGTVNETTLDRPTVGVKHAYLPCQTEQVPRVLADHYEARGPRVRPNGAMHWRIPWTEHPVACECLWRAPRYALSKGAHVGDGGFAITTSVAGE
jgi:hypothetical protein